MYKRLKVRVMQMTDSSSAVPTAPSRKNVGPAKSIPPPGQPQTLKLCLQIYNFKQVFIIFEDR